MKFNADIDSIDWERLLSDNVNESISTFNAYIQHLFDFHAPKKKVTIKEHGHPWITPTIKEMIRKRNEAHNRSRRTGLVSHKVYYKDLKNVVRRAIHSEKSAYFNYYIVSKEKNPRVLWKNIKRNVVDFKKNDMDLPQHLNDPEQINSHFLNVSGKNSVDLSQLTYFEFHRYCSTTFALKPVTEAMVTRIIRSIKTNAEGVDGISLDMLLMTLPRTLTIITAIVNQSIATGIFPDCWKAACVRPIPKIVSPVDLKDLRPISILPLMSKILEKAVSMQLTDYLESNSILPSNQSGFRKGRSTTTALLEVVDNVLAAQDRGEGTILALLDFSRAFDTINITLLLSKLTYYGFDPGTVRWFASYLSGRSQQVQVCSRDGGAAVSGTQPVVRGVPQGSILGPILFILYSADITESIRDCECHLYADDLQIYVTCKPNGVHSAVEKLNRDLSRVACWSEKNSLFLNPLKSKFLVLGTKHLISAIVAQNPRVCIADDDLSCVAEARNLGVLMDGLLHFENHVCEIVRNCFYRLKVLYRVRAHLSVDIRVKLCDSLILSKLSYADTVFHDCLLSRTKKTIQRLQNACARFCFDIPYRSHVTPFLNKGKLLKMEARRTLHLATLLFGIIKTEKPSYLFDKLNFSIRAVRQAPRLLFPRHKGASFRGSFKYAATKCWNNIPPPIRNVKSLCKFKKDLRDHLLNLQISST